MTALYLSMGLMAALLIGLGLLYIFKPNLAWKWQRGSLEMWYSIHAERTDSWYTRAFWVGMFCICLGLMILSVTISWVSIDRTKSHANATSTAEMQQQVSDMATLEVIFASPLPTLQAQAQSRWGEILLLSNEERDQLGIGESPVYFGICGHNDKFYLIVKDWGTTHESYQYGRAIDYEVSYGMIGGYVGCGGNGYENQWQRIDPVSFDYESLIQSTQIATTQESIYGTATPRPTPTVTPSE